MISSQAALWLICALNNPHNTLQGEVQITFYVSCMTWLVIVMWVHLLHLANPEMEEKKKEFWDSSRLLPSPLHFKHLLIAGRGLLNFDPAPLLLLLVTSLFLLILLLRRSTDTNQNSHKQEQQEINPEAATVKHYCYWLVGALFSHLVFRRFPSFSDSLSSSLIPDSALESAFSKSESSESSLPTGRQTNKIRTKVTCWSQSSEYLGLYY